MDLYLRKVVHSQARDNYRVILNDDGLETEIGSIGIQHASASAGAEHWAWAIDNVITMREAGTAGIGQDRKDCMKQFRTVWENFSADPARLTEFLRAKRKRLATLAIGATAFPGSSSALENRQKHFVIDGEAVVLGVDGIPDFNALHSRQHDAEVQLYAFDCLALDGDDTRSLPLSMRKTNLARLLARRPDGIFVAPFEVGEIGPDLFRKACDFGLEGLVSKRADRPYRAGRSKDWIKVKHPAMARKIETF
jgi:bifunctional non-homologous end joining protein LigD